jgi:hypothetical protein
MPNARSRRVARIPAINPRLWLAIDAAVSRNWLRLLRIAIATLPTARIGGWISISRVRLVARWLVCALNRA